MKDLAKIRLLIMDCDGVLTDGRLYFSEIGEALKAFDVRDGQGIVSWHKAGFDSGIISGRDAGDLIRSRAGELGIKFVYTGSIDKLADLERIVATANVTLDEVAYIGDDICDLEVMRKVGFSVAVADAVDEVKSVAEYVTQNGGGRGAVRELIDMILNKKKS